MQKKYISIFCILLSIFALMCTAEAVDVYVSNTGNDAAAGTAEAPVKNLARAYAILGTNGGTIYVQDAVTVTATKNNCFIEPVHSGNVTILGCTNDAALIFNNSGASHYHLRGTTKFSDLTITDNTPDGVIITADNHRLIMGKGLQMSSARTDVTYSGGHRYCGARISLVASYLNEQGNLTSGTAGGGSLEVNSGEYWSVSAWRGGAVTVPGGEVKMHFGSDVDTEEIWVRYLSPGLFGSLPDAPLTGEANTGAQYPAVSIVIRDGFGMASPYCVTQNAFSGQMTVNWILCSPILGIASAFAPKEFYPESDAEYSVNLYMNPSDANVAASAKRLTASLPETRVKSKPIDNVCVSQHQAYNYNPQKRICLNCGQNLCLHRTFQYIVTQASTCSVPGVKLQQCTDTCGEIIATLPLTLDPNNHAGHRIKTTYDPTRKRMAHRCSGCNALFSMMSGAPAADVYVGKSAGTPVSIDTIAAHYAASNVQAGSTPQCPFENFEDAMNCAAVAAKVHGQATVHILDDAYVPDNYTTPAHSGTIIITGGTLHFDEPRRYFKLYGNTTFEHLTFCSAYTEDSSSLIISARNYKLVMGEGIVMGNADTIPTEEGFPDCNSVKMYVFGGYIGPSNYTMNTDITIRSGDYWCIGGWNMNASTNDGASKITIGKTNPDDKLQVFYLTPFSRGDGYITQPAEGTIIVDGDLYVKRFYVTTINKATSNIEYVTNVVLKGNITGVNMEEVDLPFDIRGTNTPYPKTTVNVFTDERVISAVENAYVFLDNPWGTGMRDITLYRLNATVNGYSYTRYCAEKLFGHADSDGDNLCDECGYAMTE